MSRYTRRTCPAVHQNPQTWPGIDIGLLQGDERDRAQKYQELITRYLNGEQVRRPLEAAGISHHALLMQFNRCLSRARDGRIFGQDMCGRRITASDRAPAPLRAAL